MRLFKRMTDILSANLNDVVDQWEDPEVMLKQAIREMEADLQRLMERAACVIASETLLRKQLTEHESQVKRWHQRAEVAVRDKDDDKARRALRCRQDVERLVAVEEEQLEVAAATSGKLRLQVDELRVSLSQARQKLSVLIARHQATVTRRQFARDRHGVINADHARARFARMQRRIEESEAETEALLDLAGPSLDELMTDDFDADIEVELERLKNTVSPS